MRAPNEIDFWRGLALVTIFVNHIPGFFYERFTHRNLGLSDSAELFVFLAGWSLRRVAASETGPHGRARLVFRLFGRALTLYVAQVFILILALGVIAAAALTLDNPFLLEWTNAALVFQEPVRAHVGLVLLTHQLGFFDILPLYVVLMLIAPLIVLLHRQSAALVLGLSLAVYAATLVFAVNIPTWPGEGTWYFDPLAWQLIFVLGFLVADAPALHGAVRRWRVPVRVLGAVLLVGGAVLALRGIEPDPLRLPEPRLFFMFDKTFLTPARLLHFGALVIVFAGTFRYVLRYAAPPARFLSMLGRNSLDVFCVGSLLSLTAQVVRYTLGGDRLIDTGILAGGLVILGLTAWMSEWRDRLPRH